MWIGLLEKLKRKKTIEVDGGELEVGERAEKVKTIVKNKIIHNIRTNLFVILLSLYVVIIAFWNMLTLLLIGDISLRIFALLIIDAVNLPMVVIASIVFTGKYKTLNYEKETNDAALRKEIETIKTILGKDKDIALKEQEILNLKLIQQLNNTIGDLSEEIRRTKKRYKKKMEYVREISEYRCQLAAKDGKVPNAVMENKNWSDANDTIEVIEQAGDEDDAIR